MSKKTSLFLLFIISTLTLTACRPSSPLSNTATPSPVSSSLPMATSPSPVAPQSKTYEFTATQSGQIALDLLQANETIETVDYGTAGLFVQAINGVAGDNSAYWAFYVNNSYAKLGASQTKLQKGDTIKFVYEAVSASETLSP